MGAGAAVLWAEADFAGIEVAPQHAKHLARVEGSGLAGILEAPGRPLRQGIETLIEQQVDGGVGLEFEPVAEDVTGNVLVAVVGADVIGADEFLRHFGKLEVAVGEGGRLGLEGGVLDVGIGEQDGPVVAFRLADQWNGFRRRGCDGRSRSRRRIGGDFLTWRHRF